MSRPRFSTCLAGLLYLLILLPAAIVVTTSFTDSRAIVFPPPGFSLRWYPAVLADSQMMDGLKLSVAIAVGAAAGGTLVGTLAALYLSRPEVAARNLLAAILLAPLSVPTVMTGFALLIAFTRYRLLNPVGLAIAHTVITAPYIVRMVSASLAAADPTLPRAAAVLGANPLRVFLHVTLPLARPGVVAGAMFAFLVSFNHVTISAFLALPGLNTLPVVIFHRIEQLLEPSVAAAATLMIALTSVTMVILDRRFGLFRSLFR